MRTVRTKLAFLGPGTLAIALALLPMNPHTSWADPVRVTFTAHPAANDPVNPGPSSGSFTFDSSLIPPGEGLLSSPSGLATSVSFFWGSTLFDITTADVIELRFDASGALDFWHLGGRSNGLAAWRSQPAELVVDDFSLSAGAGGGSSFYTLQGHAGTFRGSVVTDTPAPVPEPSTWLLIGSGALALLRRRRSRDRPDAIL